MQELCESRRTTASITLQWPVRVSCEFGQGFSSGTVQLTMHLACAGPAGCESGTLVRFDDGDLIWLDPAHLSVCRTDDCSREPSEALSCMCAKVAVLWLKENCVACDTQSRVMLAHPHLRVGLPLCAGCFEFCSTSDGWTKGENGKDQFCRCLSPPCRPS